MNGAWLYLPEVLTVLLSALCFVAGAWVCVLAADVINRSTVGTSASGEAASSGAGIRVVESERKQPPARQPRDERRAVVPAGPSATRTPT